MNSFMESSLSDFRMLEDISSAHWGQSPSAQAYTQSENDFASSSHHQEEILTCTSAPELHHPQPQQACDWEDVLALMNTGLSSSRIVDASDGNLDSLVVPWAESPKIGSTMTDRLEDGLPWLEDLTVAYSTPVSNTDMVDLVKCQNNSPQQLTELNDRNSTTLSITGMQQTSAYPHLLSPTLSEPDEENPLSMTLPAGNPVDWDQPSDLFTISPPPDSETQSSSSPLHTITQGAVQLTAENEFLVQSRLSGMSYKEIRESGNFQISESTLRGRFRSLTKAPQSRLRRPRWSEKDVSQSVPRFVSLLCSPFAITENAASD